MLAPPLPEDNRGNHRELEQEGTIDARLVHRPMRGRDPRHQPCHRANAESAPGSRLSTKLCGRTGLPDIPRRQYAMAQPKTCGERKLRRHARGQKSRLERRLLGEAIPDAASRLRENSRRLASLYFGLMRAAAGWPSSMSFLPVSTRSLPST